MSILAFYNHKDLFSIRKWKQFSILISKDIFYSFKRTKFKNLCFYVVFLFSSLNSYNLLFNQKDGTSYRNCISLAKWSYFRFRYQTFHLNIDNFQTNRSHSCLIWLKPHFFNAWVNPILSAVSVVQGVPPICWQLRTKIWKLKHHICQKISPVLKLLNKKLSDGRFRWHGAKSFL